MAVLFTLRKRKLIKQNSLVGLCAFSILSNDFTTHQGSEFCPNGSPLLYDIPITTSLHLSAKHEKVDR